MMQEYLLTEMLTVDVHIYFRSAYLLVSKHFLNDSQVGSAFQKMCGEAMAEGVWRYCGTYASCFAQRLHNMEDGYA